MELQICRRNEKTIDDLNELLVFRSPNNIEINVKEIRKRGNRIKTRYNEYNFSDLDTQKHEVLEELKNAKYNDLEDMINKRQLTYDETIDMLDLKHISSKRIGYSVQPGIYGFSDLNKTLDFFIIL